jgi:hypothetical protein
MVLKKTKRSREAPLAVDSLAGNGHLLDRGRNDLFLPMGPHHVKVVLYGAAG